MILPGVVELDARVNQEFGSRLVPLGFNQVDRRRWIRSSKLPIRELFTVGALKGATYSPAWGFSCGFVPALRGRAFRRQSTERNACKDLIIDPIDSTGRVPPEAFHFISGWDPVPVEKIKACADHFVPLATADFDLVNSVDDFCAFFLNRSRLNYQRFGFENYVQHLLAYGFVLILTGQWREGLRQIEEFCHQFEMDAGDHVLKECIRRAKDFADNQ